jgi:hypothetical protein
LPAIWGDKETVTGRKVSKDFGKTASIAVVGKGDLGLITEFVDREIDSLD